MESKIQHIEFGDITVSSFQAVLNQYSSSKKVIIVDDNTHDNCLEFLITSYTELADAEVILLPAGEENKVMEVCFQVWEAMSEYEIGRKDLVINLGGGVVTDMGGFIASTFKRGIDFINIPTTLLGMVDASIGGKTGIDLGPYKNQIGTFALPIKTFIDQRFLASLPEEELWNGFSEMTKHALIQDGDFWNQLKTIENSSQLIDLNMIQRAAAIKMNVVDIDPFEKGDRKKLNFGHTIGHALEGFFLEYSEPIAHGQAVAAGMLLESRLSNAVGLLTIEELQEIELVLKKFPVLEFQLQDIPQIIRLMHNDKKNSEGVIKGVVLKSIGESEYDFRYDEALLTMIFESYFV
ncbi:MAG: 3-dehydroquinate synthase [Bacteroidota bacterium]